MLNLYESFSHLLQSVSFKKEEKQLKTKNGILTIFGDKKSYDNVEDIIKIEINTGKYLGAKQDKHAEVFTLYSGGDAKAVVVLFNDDASDFKIKIKDLCKLLIQ